MDIFDEELLEFWKALNANQVKYLMVGGFAVNMHGFLRATQDVDIWIKDETQNRKNFGKALETFGYSEINFEELKFIPGWANFYIGKGVALDILIDMKGLEDFTFDECLELATVAEIETVKVPFLHINHLIVNKKAVNRSKDQIDVIELEKIKLLRKEMGLD
ncbi:MAG TPA: nucleotidyltransferase [Chitinophagales bacterium]|jgi:hypothetical protein|nr:nucleotidyltransferase [Chitinophagales bacterium]